MSSVSVLVPTVNEIGNIDALLDRIHAAIPYEHEIIVIDGSSDDGTPERVVERGDAMLDPVGEKSKEALHVAEVV